MKPKTIDDMKAILPTIFAITVAIFLDCCHTDSGYETEQAEFEREQSELTEEQAELKAEHEELRREYSKIREEYLQEKAEFQKEQKAFHKRIKKDCPTNSIKRDTTLALGMVKCP